MKIIEVINDGSCSTRFTEKEVCATVGFFDGVHSGHRFLLARLRDEATQRRLPTAVVTFRNHPRLTLNADYIPRLLTSYDEKMSLLADAGIDYVFVLNFDARMAALTAEKFIIDILHQQLNVKCLLVGYDHRFGHNREEGFEDYCRYASQCGMETLQVASNKQYGMTVPRHCEARSNPETRTPDCFVETLDCFVPRNDECPERWIASCLAMTNTLSVSSSSIRRCLSEGNIATANAMLGYRYRLTGKVVSGAKIGRTLGFPTANIVLNDKTKMLPKNGSYAVTVEETKRGLLYIGSRPTIEDEAGQNSNNGTSIEVHIIDFDGDLYGQTLTVEFVAFIRDEMKFDSPEALKQQIAADMVETLHATSPRTP